MSAKKYSFIEKINILSNAIYSEDATKGYNSYENIRYRIILQQNNLKNYFLFFAFAGMAAIGSIFFPFLPIMLMGTAFVASNLLKANNSKNPGAAYMRQSLFLTLALASIISLSTIFPPFALLITTLGIGLYITATNYKSIKANFANSIAVVASLSSLIAVALVPILPTLFTFIPTALMPFVPTIGIFLVSVILVAYTAHQVNIAKQNYIRNIIKDDKKTDAKQNDSLSLSYLSEQLNGNQKFTSESKTTRYEESINFFKPKSENNSPTTTNESDEHTPRTENESKDSDDENYRYKK